ncbi:hypothetical protein A2U01_0092824, partial [Trifolium medium]|nr:hypothetical protein [Trifolium medium]
VWQPSVGEKIVEVPSPSYNAAHRGSQPSLAHNLNTGADGGCEVEPDDALAVLLAVVVAVVPLLLPVLPVTPSLPSEK